MYSSFSKRPALLGVVDWSTRAVRVLLYPAKRNHGQTSFTQGPQKGLENRMGKPKSGFSFHFGQFGIDFPDSDPEIGPSMTCSVELEALESTDFLREGRAADTLLSMYFRTSEGTYFL
jgi:hypothetical protein